MAVGLLESWRERRRVVALRRRRERVEARQRVHEEPGAERREARGQLARGLLLADRRRR